MKENLKFELQVKEELCTGCGNCMIACPINAMKFVEISGGKGGGVELAIEDGIVHLILEECNGCGTCIRACAQKAIEVRALSPKALTKSLSVKQLAAEEKKKKAGEEEHEVHAGAEEEAPKVVYEFDPVKRAVIESAVSAFDRAPVRNLIESGKSGEAKVKILEKIKGGGGKK